MDIDTQTHLHAFRALLTFRLKELQSEINAARASGIACEVLRASDVSDRKDQAALKQWDAIDEAEESRDLAELAEVRAALDRLDHGVYGDCADCGEPIGMQRLLIQPAAARCGACQESFESNRRHMRS